jgi:hypothetical protein
MPAGTGGTSAALSRLAGRAAGGGGRVDDGEDGRRLENAEAIGGQVVAQPGLDASAGARGLHLRGPEAERAIGTGGLVGEHEETMVAGYIGEVGACTGDEMLDCSAAGGLDGELLPAGV